MGIITPIVVVVVILCALGFCKNHREKTEAPPFEEPERNPTRRLHSEIQNHKTKRIIVPDSRESGIIIPERKPIEEKRNKRKNS